MSVALYDTTNKAICFIGKFNNVAIARNHAFDLRSKSLCQSFSIRKIIAGGFVNVYNTSADESMVRKI